MTGSVSKSCLRRMFAALASSTALLVAVEQGYAQNACTQDTSTHVTCTGGQLDTFGTGVESGLTIDIDSTATVAGINVHDATINNNDGTISAGGLAVVVDSATIKNGTGSISGATGISAGTSVTITGNDGRIEGTGASGVGIDAGPGGTATVTNGIGTITGVAGGIIADSITVGGNNGTIEATGRDGAAVGATTSATVTNGSGTIRANNTGGVAIFADVITGTVTVTNGTGLIQANGGSDTNALLFGAAIDARVITVTGNDRAIGGAATVTNGVGNITGERFGISSRTVTVKGNAGTIEAIAANGAAIEASTNFNGVTATATVDNAGKIQATASGGIGTQARADAGTTNSTGVVTVNSNIGDGISTGIISGDAFGIDADTVTVKANSGLIQATGATGTAINSNNVNVTGNTGHITANTSGTAIGATGTATVTNLSGGLISAGAFGINANTVKVDGNAGTIEATGTNGDAIHAATDADVHNTGGTIQATGRGVFASGIAKVTNDGGTISGGLAGIAGATVNVTGNAGTISGVTAIFSEGPATVHNLSGGQVNGTLFGIDTVLPTSVGQLDITNDAGATIKATDAVNGVGIRGSGNVTSAGTITGGTGAGGASVQFVGTGSNTLTLKDAAVLNGDAKGGAGATNNLILQGSGTLTNNFVGFNSLDMTGASWTLNGNSEVGTVTMNGAQLVVGNSANPNANLTGEVTVANSSTLEGAGTITGNIHVMPNGFVNPLTNFFGAFRVTGNATFEPGSIFSVNANAAGQASKLAMGGTATLNGGEVFVNAQTGGTYAPSTRYNILTATGGLSGTFTGGAATNLIFLSPTLTYDANNVFLTLCNANIATCSGVTGGGGGGGPGGGGGGGTVNPGFGFAAVAQTRNQNAVATALDASPFTNPLVNALLMQTSISGTLQAFDALSGEVFGSVQNAQARQSQFTRDAMLGRMRQASYAGAPGAVGALSFGGPELAYAGDDAHAANAADFPAKAPAAAREQSRNLTFWALGLGGWGHADSDGNAASLKSRFGGFLSGADARFGDTWRAGLVAGYTRTNLNVDARASSAGIDSVQFGGYASGRVGVFNVRGGASLTYDSIDTSRGVFFPGFSDQTHAHVHGNVGQVFGEVGYGMVLGQVAVEPLAGLAYVHVHDGSFLESGGAAALSASASNENLGYSSLGIRFATAVPLANGTVLVPRGTVQWQHAFGDVTPVTALAFQGTGAAFTVAGIPIAHDAALVEAGFDWRFSPQAKLGAFYQGELAAHAQTHAFKGGFTWDF